MARPIRRAGKRADAPETAPMQARMPPRPARPAWLRPGTIIYTLDGALPVEFLVPGDRIVTRAGARRLRRLRVAGEPGGGFALVFDHPETIYADGEPVPA